MKQIVYRPFVFSFRGARRIVDGRGLELATLSRGETVAERVRIGDNHPGRVGQVIGGIFVESAAQALRLR